MRSFRIGLLAVVASVFVALPAGGQAAEGSAGGPTLCSSASGQFSNNQTRTLTIQHIYWSQWSSESNRPYRALRYRPNETVAYSNDRPGGAWEFINSVDVDRRTAQRRLGTAQATYFIAQWTKTSC